jgi:hypothetical protein
MIAGRRDRKRSLIRSNAMTPVMTRNVSSRDGVAALQGGISSEFGYSARMSPSTMSVSPAELTACFRQLSVLHAAGILTDEEFFAARGRLLGS